MHKRPEIGEPPSYLFDDRTTLGTGSRFRHAMSALKGGGDHAPGLCREYFQVLGTNLERFRIEPKEGEHLDDQVIASVDAFLPYRDEMVQLLFAIAEYRPELEMYQQVHRLFESILPYTLQPPGRTPWADSYADSFRFINYELFLYATAVFLQTGRFKGVNELVEQEYYLDPGSPDAYKGGMVPFTWLNHDMPSFHSRKRRLQLTRLSPIADLLEERAKRHDVTFRHVMQADFVLYLRFELDSQKGDRGSRYWLPHSLAYAAERETAFEIFARAQSQKFFEDMKIALGVSSKDELHDLMNWFREDASRLPRWDFRTLNPAVLMNFSDLATRP